MPDKSEVRLLPRPFGPYLLLEELATGGMARVFRAWKLPDGPHCALKQLLGRHAEKPAVVRRFSREAVVTSLLEHENVARVLDAGLDEGLAWIAMELVDGETIADVVRRALTNKQWIPQPIVAAILLAMCEGLDYVHDARGPDGEPLELVHRDLSPRNVMVGFNGVLKIIDFGVARAEVGDFQTKPGHLLGSLRYLSPEQAMGMQVDRRSDLYTLGVIAYELYTLEPYVRDDHPLRVLRAIVQAPIRPESELSELAAPLRAVVRRALAKKPEDRFQNAGEMGEALRAALGAVVPASVEELAAYMRAAFGRGREDSLVTKSESMSSASSASISESVSEPQTVSASVSVSVSLEPSTIAFGPPPREDTAPVIDTVTAPGRTLRNQPALRDTVMKVIVRRPVARFPFVLLGFALIVLGVAWMFRTPPPPVVSAPGEKPAPVIAPVAKARAPVIEEPPPPVEEKTAPARKPRRPDPQPVDPVRPYAELHRLIDEVREDPSRFDAAYDAIRAAAENSSARVSVLAALNAARLAGNTAGLAEALRLLEAAAN